MKIESSYFYNDKKYKVNITYKKIKRIIYRLKDGVIEISCPLGVSQKIAIANLDKLMPTLLKSEEYKEKPINNDGIYVFGEFIKFDDGFIKVNGHNILFIDKKDFYKKVSKIVLPIFKEMFEELEKEITPNIKHEIALKDVTTTYGVNYTTKHKIFFNITLFHFAKDIIKSVMVHELCHDYVANHSKEFYKYVYKFMPDYKILHGKLTKGVYS